MTGFKKSSLLHHQTPYNSLYVNPLNTQMSSINADTENTTPKEGTLESIFITSDNKENAFTLTNKNEKFHSRNKENVNVNVTPLGVNNGSSAKENQLLEEKKPVGTTKVKSCSLKPSSLQLCMQLNEPDSSFGLKLWDPLESEAAEIPGKAHVWDFSDSEAAPASSWSTLPNRSLLCRPLPLDIGRCTCIIVKEASLEGLNGGSVYSLYTNEGKGRQDRKLAVAHHRRRKGRSEFTIAQNAKGLLCGSDESLLGTVNANFMGSKYQIWDQGNPLDSIRKQSKLLLGVVAFVPTISTCAGSYRTIRAWIPKHQSMQLKNITQIQHTNGLPKDWECKTNKAHELFSKVPHYNRFLKRYELDFRERVKAELKIQSSSKNFQLTLEENGRQSILQLGRVGKSQYVMDYRYPLTGYQAFCICLASIDSKLCCTV